MCSIERTVSCGCVILWVAVPSRYLVGTESFKEMLCLLWRLLDVQLRTGRSHVTVLY